ncbi:MAG: flagellar protein FlaG [Spirochaetaceae bacterium]|jgi:flagellar protein FlaG|nr:flagellar protein FlaG [Spirochaetaceae bacterium]
MGIQIAMVGNGINPVPPQELPQDRGAPRHQPLPAQNRMAEQKAVIEKFESSLPGNRDMVDIKTTAADLERISLAFNKKLRFMVDHESHEITVKVIDPETDKVIKVLPPEELQRLHGKIKETLGFLFDERI